MSQPEWPEITNDALDEPLDVLVSMVASLGDKSIDPNLLGTMPDDPRAANGSLLETFNAAVSAPAMPGSICGLLPPDVYVFARGTDARKPIRLGRLGWGRKCHVVAEPLKQIIESLPGDRSEFYPVSVVYRDPAGAAEIGGGEVVHGRHWIWYCYAVHNLIDVNASRATFETTTQPRMDVAGHPTVTYDIVQTDPAFGLPSLVLDHVPYREAAAFHILGLWSSTPFVSPDLIRRLNEAEPNEADAIPPLAPTVLDQQRAYLAREAVRAGRLARKPPLRIVGTDWIVRDEYEPPFYPHRPSFAGA